MQPEKEWQLVSDYFGEGGDYESYALVKSSDQECSNISDTLLRDVKRALFYKEKAYSPVENCEVFQKVMSLLSSYELAGVAGRESQKKTPTYLYERLKTKIKAFGTFKKDFIFYFILVLRFQQTYFADIYQSSVEMKEQLQKLVKFVIKSFNKLDPENVAEVFKSFLQRGTFDTETTPPFSGSPPIPFDVFSQFLQSCQLLVERFDDICCKIIILTMYMGTVHALEMTRPLHVWTKFFIESTYNNFNENMIEEMRKGREQAVHFEVPREWMFDEGLVTTVFLGENNETFHSFKLLKCFLKAVQPTCADVVILIRDILNPIRVRYKTVLDNNERMTVLTCISENSGTPEFTTVKEGLEVVEQIVIELEDKQSQLAVEELACDEIQKWLELILSVIDIKGKSASDCCQLFCNEQFQCCILHQQFITKKLIKAIEGNFSLLSVDSFVPLFEGLPIWHKDNIAAYLADYAVDDFGLDLNANGWSVLLKSIVERFPATEVHDFLLEFFKLVADWYSQHKYPRDFFGDLFILELPTLLFNGNDFYNFLDKYYERFQRKCVFTEIIVPIMRCVPKQGRNYFQDTVLQVVAKGVVKEILDCKDPETCICHIIENINVISCREYDSSVQMFGWRVVGELSEKLLIGNQSFSEKYTDIYLSIGGLYKKHCELATPPSTQNLSIGDKEHSLQIPENLPSPIESYFKWVQCMLDFILEWRKRLNEERFTHENLLSHKRQHKGIHRVMTALGFESFVVSEEDLKRLTKTFHEKRNKVNCILIHQNNEKNIVRWCYFPSVLQLYGVSLPDVVLQDIKHFLDYPDEREGIHHRKPDQSSACVSITVKDGTMLRDLNLLCERLENFLNEFKEDSLKVFVFFRVHQSSLFEKYLRYNIKCLFDEALRSSTEGQRESEVTVRIFSEAIMHTKVIICRLIQGDAEYREMKAEGSVVLEDIDTEKEFSVLEMSVEKLSLSVSGKSGLLGVKAMIELFKASSHIKLLEKIFDRYKLKLCNGDKAFIELRNIKLHINEHLTPNAAREYLKTVKKTLQISDKKSVDCLGFLREVFMSKEFYEFLLHRGFYGIQGHRAFRQQYALITAQLQNKASDFEEKILNHLLPAFQFLSPFIAKYDDNNERTEPSFKDLVREMWTLDTEVGPKKLRNVYQNVHLVIQWFSEVQGNTAETIETDLEDVMRTGIFQLKADSPLKLEFQRSAGVSMSETKPPQHTYHWHTNEISEFITCLGFLSSKGEKSKSFICLNEVAHQILDLINKIKHFEPNISLKISCSETLEEAKSQLKCLQEKLENGRAIVREVQMEHRWLYYIPGSAVSELHQVMRENNVNSAIEIVLQFIPLSGNTYQRRQICTKIAKRVKKALKGEENSMVQKEVVSAVATQGPMKCVGRFLGKVLPIKLPALVLNQAQQCCFVHFTTGYSQENLMMFLLKLFERKFPQHCQVWWCDEITTEDELEYFLNRIDGISSIYVLLEVNKLPIMLQEYVSQRIIDFQKYPRTSVVHCVDTKPSVLHDTFDIVEYNVCEQDISNEIVAEAFQHQETIKWSSIELVCGIPGNGKSYYILNKLNDTCSAYRIIPINEGFTRHQVIKSLCSLPVYPDAFNSETKVYGICFNFTMYLTEDTLRVPVNQNMLKRIGWFLFELLVLGKVDDFKTASSFQLHSTISWRFYIEVPPLTSAPIETTKELDDTILKFRELFPVFKYIGRTVMIGFFNISHPCVDAEVQLVCKYFRARTGNSFQQKKRKSIKPNEKQDLPPNECIKLLNDHVPPFANRKISQKLFIRYLYRRCQFLEKLQKRRDGAALNVCLTLFEFILDEATDFVNPKSKEASCQSIPFQILYNAHEDGSINLSLLTTNPVLINPEYRQLLRKIKIDIPTERDLRSRDYLVRSLSTGLNIPENLCDEILTNEDYVVTLDFVLKMLNIHERKQCGVPVVIQGETGVGKTALIEILSKLWNVSYKAWIDREKQSFKLFIKEKLQENLKECSERYKEALERIEDGNQQENMAFIAELPLLHTGQFYTLIQDYFLKRKSEWIWYFLEAQDRNVTFSQLIHDLEMYDTPEVSTLIAVNFLNCRVLNHFFKISIHAALKPQELGSYLRPIFKKAREVQEKCSGISSKIDPPTFVVFFDEINTSSCAGFLKEIISDSTLFGQAIPTNVFIIGAANPHRGDATTLLESIPELWCRPTYHVQPLHPTLQYLVWDYGSLGHDQEEDYVREKLRMVQPIYFKDEATLCDTLTELILRSQEIMRENTLKFLTENNFGKIDTEVIRCSSQSCVSQRDIQRVITFFCWILKVYSRFQPHGKYADMKKEYYRRAVLVSLGIVYYLRQPKEYREIYEKKIQGSNISRDTNFSKAFNDDLEWFTKHITVPEGIQIVKTTALKENIFATIACICTRTPVLIVGEPGSSKSLSFHLVAETLRGKESTSDIFKAAGIFPSVDPYFLQCSCHTTSKDIVTVFERAKGRQKSFVKKWERNYVVFMDEAGLPEESRESLKALHHYLDNPSVAFVGISNHVLDAAKTNRCVSVVRMKMSGDDLKYLAKGCICGNPSEIPPERAVEVDNIMKFCNSYQRALKKQHNAFFGLRDFVHFLHYIRSNYGSLPFGELVLKGLERNFNGNIQCKQLFIELLEEISADQDEAEHLYKMNARGMIDILRDSLSQSQSKDTQKNAARYKLIIDPSKDNSLIRYLFKYDIVEKKNTRMFMCSDAFSDEDVQKVVIVSTICHSVTKGDTVILCQTNEINESFYDLFNLSYRYIDDPKEGRLYYANVAVGPHIKPCRVDSKFHCIVLLHEEEVPMMPAPFLNRFEKYRITYDNMVDSALQELPYGWRSLIEAAYAKVKMFAEEITASESIFGYHKETVPSILLWFLPAKFNSEMNNIMRDHSGDPKQFLLEIVIDILKSVGFYIPKITREEMELDIKSIFHFICSNAYFDEYIKEVNDKSAADAREKAVFILNSMKQEDRPTIPKGASMIISLTLQWIVRHLCKALMQVMTPEAVVIFDQKIPSTYIVNYLKHQQHFHLRKLINQHYNIMLTESPSGAAPTKLIVFCRTSLFITNLTFDCAGGEDDADIPIKLIKKLSHHSEAWFLERLHEFYGINDTKSKCVLITVNMQETSVKAINHIRMIIEDTENHYTNHEKIAVVLLHYPLSMSSFSSYPTLFQAGWSHYYLDSISMTHDDINTEQWISLLLESPQIEDESLETLSDAECNLHTSGDQSPSSISTSSTELVLEKPLSSSATLVENVCVLIKLSIPTVISLLASKITLNASKHYQKDIASKETLFSVLLNEKGFEKLLYKRFETYLTPTIFAGVLRRAASTIFRRESLSRMSIIIQNSLCAKFSEFMLYMVSVINESGSFHVIFEQDCEPVFIELVKVVISNLDLPEFSNLSHLSILKRRSTFPRQIFCHFPFYNLICNSMDNIIRECKCEAKGISSAEESFSIPTEENVTKLVGKRVLDICQRKSTKHNGKVVAATLKLMEETEGLLQSYLCDFMFDKYTVVCAHSGVVFNFLKKYLLPIKETFHKTSLPYPARCLISCHIYFHYHSNELTENLPIVKLLNELHPMAKDSDELSLKLVYHTSDEIPLLRDTKDLCAYIVDLLLCSTNAVWLNTTQDHHWYFFYRKMINNQHVKELLYRNMEPSTEAKMSTIHTAYAILHCRSIDNKFYDCARDTFWTLYNKLINKKEDAECWPRLEDCVSITLDVLSHSISKAETSSIIQNLLEHFFSEQKLKYHMADVQWLIQFSNGNVALKDITILTDSTDHGVPFGVVKHYLTRVLIHDENPKGEDITLMHFNEEYRRAIGEELQKGSSAEEDSHYSPYFYVDTLPSCQSLAHLYFTIVFEVHMETCSNTHEYASIMSEVDKLQSQRSAKECNMKLLLSIEQQALIQILLKTIAEQQVQNKMGKAESTEDLLCKVSSSDMLKNHGIVTAMHLLNYTRNHSKLKQHVDTLDSNGMKCLAYVASELPSHTTCQHLRLLSMDLFKNLLPYYETVCKEMKTFFVYKESYDEDDLLNLHKLWSKSSLLREHHMASKDCLIMMMWLAAYYNFFLERRYFDELISVLTEKRFVHPKQLKLFKILLSREKWSAKPFFENLFDNRLQDKTKMEMRTCIVNIIAIIFGSPSKSTHLWYHFMAPEELDGTFLTGFMYLHVVSSKENSFYKDGTHLTSNGMYGKYAYLADGGERHLTLPSLYVMLWLNFATFGMAEVSAKSKIRFVCKDPQDTLKICSERLERLWTYMTVNLNFCDEHVTCLITHCLCGIMKAFCDGKLQGGVLRDYTDLKTYETMWQKQIFDPAYSHVSQQVLKEISSTPCLKVIDNMKRRFPKIPSLDDFSCVVQTKLWHKEEFKLLSHFTVEYQRLYLGTCLLPDLVRLYQWLHQEMAHSVTMETASKITLANIRMQIKDNATDTLEKYFDLYSRILENFHKYVTLTGRHKGVPKGRRQSHITERTNLIDLVSGVPKGKDCIYRVITDIISSHRNLVMCESTTTKAPKGHKPAEPSAELHPSLIASNDCIIHVESEPSKIKMLLRKWTSFWQAFPESGENHEYLDFNVKGLQEDVAEFYLVGKPMIQNAETMYTWFHLLQPEKKIVYQELAQVKHQLPHLFHEPLQKYEQRALQKEFHSATFQDYQSLITIFSISVHILVSEVKQATDVQELAEKCLCIFLCSGESEEKTFWDTETDRCRLSMSQIAYIKNVKLKNLSSTLALFMKWNDDGVHNFHMLPYGVKGPLTVEEEEQILSSRERYGDDITMFSKDLRNLENVLADVQLTVLKTAHQVPMKTLLDIKNTPLADCIPESICIHQYVSLRLIMRRLIIECQKTLPEIQQSEKWQEYEQEPWKNILHCDMESSAVNSQDNPSTQESFGFAVKAKEENTMKEKFKFTGEGGIVHTPLIHKEYMSEMISVDVSSPPISDMAMYIPPGKEVRELSTDEVCKFLADIGLPECKEWAVAEDITGEDLMVFKTNEDLDGLENSFCRLKLLVNLQCLQNNFQRTEMAKQYPPHKIAQFLAGENYAQYTGLFIDNGIDGEILHRASDQALERLGITCALDRALMKQKFSKLIGESSSALPEEKFHEILMKSGLEEVATFVKEHGIDSDTFENASDGLRDEMKIKSGDYRKINRKIFSLKTGH